jgi:hypothetical protein
MLRTELEAAAELPVGRLRHYEDGTVKPQAATRARLAKVVRAPDLEEFGDEDG